MFIGIDPTYIKSGVELNISIIKTVFMMLCIFYTNYKITDKKIEINFKFIGSNLTIIMFGIILGVIKKQVNLIIWIMSTIMIISILYPRDRVIKSIVATVVSFAINYTISYITIVISFIFYLFNQTFDNYMNLIVILISHLTLLYLLFKIKRFKKGFSFLKSDDKNEYLDILVLNISIITMLLISILIHSDLVLARELMLGIATAIFIIIGVCSHRKPQKNREASKYISKPLKLTEQTDQFLDKHVSQTRRVESSSSSGGSSGSSTHSGSSGTSHGGGGRSF